MIRDVMVWLDGGASDEIRLGLSPILPCDSRVGLSSVCFSMCCRYQPWSTPTLRVRPPQPIS